MADMKYLFNEAVTNTAPPEQFAEAVRKHNEADEEFYDTQARIRQQMRMNEVNEAFADVLSNPELTNIRDFMEEVPERKPAPEQKHSPLYESLMRKAQQIQNNGHSGNEGLSGPDGH